MEPGGGGGLGAPGPLPGNNKARGGAGPPSKARDLGRPPRKDSEVSAAAAGPGSGAGGGRLSRGRGPGPGRDLPGTCRCPRAPPSGSA